MIAEEGVGSRGSVSIFLIGRAAGVPEGGGIVFGEGSGRWMRTEGRIKAGIGAGMGRVATKWVTTEQSGLGEGICFRVESID